MDDQQLIGALDIVSAFTALRQELKLQVREGRQLHETIAQQFTQFEDRWQQALLSIRAQYQQLNQSLQQSGSLSGDSEYQQSRQLALALTEIDESLHRAVAAIPETRDEPTGPKVELDKKLGATLAALPWWCGWLVRKRFEGLQRELRSLSQPPPPISDPSLLALTRQGLEMIRARLGRLFNECELSRVDVDGKPFDAESMHAVELVQTTNAASAHVCEQLSPAYYWRGKLLRYAEVRVAR